MVWLISTLLLNFSTCTVRLLWHGKQKHNGQQVTAVSSLIISGTNHPVTLHHMAEEWSPQMHYYESQNTQQVPRFPIHHKTVKFSTFLHFI
jgi:hypothetical protein